MSELRCDPPLDRLFEMGKVAYSVEWQGTDPDYVRELGLAQEHVPALIEIARRWLDADDYPKDVAGWAPIHAWRALGQLRAAEAVEPLLAMLSVLTETGDDYHMYDFPVIFGLIGPPAVPALTDYLHNPENGLYARSIAGDGLCEVGLRHPGARRDALAPLVEQLARFEENDYELNGFLVDHLTRLKAVEAAETIERAFASNNVAEDISGNWGTVRKELGVAGLGLAPDGPPPPQQNEPARFLGGVPMDDDVSRARKKQREKQAKAKRKQHEKAKKRNRKRR